MKKTILTTLAALGLCLGASAASIITQWNFNSNPADTNTSTGTLNPSTGSGSAAQVGGVGTTFNPGSPADTSTATDNTGWRTGGTLTPFAPQGTGNKTCGVQFNLSTAGYENITLSWDQANSITANKYYRVQYSIDAGATWIDKDVVINNAGTANWNTPIATVSFASIPGASQNPNFAVRIVSELESTAVGGLAEYVAVNGVGPYSATAFLRLDLVTFSGDVAIGGGVDILSEPTSQVVAVGQPASFRVVAGGGTSTITYQWRTNGVTLPNATNSVYAIAAAQLSHAGSYDVVVANAVNSKTSAVATLTVRNPLSLAWTGLNGAVWDSTTQSWENTSTAATVAYAGGDHVLFDSRGSGASSVSLAESVNPSSVTVNADFDYTLRSDVSAKITSTTGLKKMGTGTLVLSTDNTYSGATVIEAGTLQVGAAADHGSMGTGPITNNSALVFNRSDNIVISNAIAGSGGMTNLGKGVTLLGANTYSGPIGVLSGSLTLSGNQAVNSTDVYILPLVGGITPATRLALAGGVVVSSGTTIHMSGTTAAGDLRLQLAGSGGAATINGPILLEGSWVNNIYADETAQFIINGDISADPLGYSGVVMFRGNLGSGIINGTINLPGVAVEKTDSGTWTINSTGNNWASTGIAVGTLRIGAHNALPTSLNLKMGQTGDRSTLDLAGFNQQIAALTEVAGTKIITNSSATADSTLTVGSGTFSGRIADSAAGRKTGLTINGATFTLAGLVTYSGDTTVQAGTFALSGAGGIPNSAVINLAGGGLDVSARSDAALTVGAAQKLKGNGTLSITGDLINNGTVELKVNKSDNVINNDTVAVTGQVTYGGTLKLVLSGQGLMPTDTIPVFTAGTYASSAFATIDPAVPAPGLTWNTSTLATDGILRIAGTAQPTITSAVRSASGTDIIFGGTGGPANGTFSVLASTNVAAPVATWPTVQTGSFNASGNFSVTNAITPGMPQRFFKLQVP